MEAAAKRTRASDEACLRALCIVASEGWLCKKGWSIARAVHAFAKPTRARLSSTIGNIIVNAVLARPLITALRLEGDLSSSTLALPVSLRTLELVRYCGTLDQLPQSLTSLVVSGWRGAPGIAASVRQSGIINSKWMYLFKYKYNKTLLY
jgi:hypothetical protein